MKNAAQLKQIKAAVIQINSGDDKEKNFARAKSLIHEASSRGATVIALPETFSWRGSREYIFKNAEPIPGPTTEKLSRLASLCNIYLLAGSIV
ncbi:MAG: carbon-nitrogen hydrolase family protein, partial [Proteobacteria bacterium]|nr:carbon-nitrogen hydrolase family protein [Pseudomonadota bacterium]